MLGATFKLGHHSPAMPTSLKVPQLQQCSLFTCAIASHPIETSLGYLCLFFLLGFLLQCLLTSSSASLQVCVSALAKLMHVKANEKKENKKA